ncbi:MAG: menaquinol-cytochrome C reductase [Chloroflexota bacterium]
MAQKEASGTGTGTGTVDPEAQKKRLAAMVREYGAAKVEREPSNTVLVWPNLLVIEFLAAALITLGLVVLAIIMDSPLEDHSNPNLTPNPSKAPWYFLNLQELLLHMDPSLAGVIVPGVAIVALMTIPYLDNVVGDTGIWFSTPTGKKVAIISAIYAGVLIPALIFFDNALGVRPTVQSLGLGPAVAEVIAEFIIPIAVMLGLTALLIALIRPLRPSRRDIVIALFTGFVVTYIALTIVGTGFRGEGMKLNWPWNIGLPIE